MGLLARTLLLALAASTMACYSPELRDCTLACSSTSDCADGQVCGSDRFCASPEAAGSCLAPARRDAGINSTEDDASNPRPPMVDAGMPVPPVDAAPPPDAPTQGLLTITISGHGHVYVQGHGTCDYDSAVSCQFTVDLDESVVLGAFSDDEDDWRFEKWTAGPCSGSELSTCFFQPGVTNAVTAKFKK